MQLIQNLRKRATFYLYNNYLYKRDRIDRKNGSFFMRCRRLMCTARARYCPKLDEFHIFSVCHNHEPEDMNELMKSAQSRKKRKDGPRSISASGESRSFDGDKESCNILESRESNFIDEFLDNGESQSKFTSDEGGKLRRVYWRSTTISRFVEILYRSS